MTLSIKCFFFKWPFVQKKLFRSVLQNFAKIIKKILVIEFFLKSCRLQIKNLLHQRFFPVKFVKFLRTTFENNFWWMFLSQEPYQNSKYLVHQTNKHSLKVIRPTLWNIFLKISWNIPQKMFMMEFRYNNVTS